MVVPAAAEGSCATIQLLAGRDDADVNMETNDGRTALYFAALDGKVVDCVRALLTSGGDAHVKNQVSGYLRAKRSPVLTSRMVQPGWEVSAGCCQTFRADRGGGVARRSAQTPPPAAQDPCW
eukprot:1003003-Rhodomonas_salina.4